jgi:hypothetical protein
VERKRQGESAGAAMKSPEASDKLCEINAKAVDNASARLNLTGTQKFPEPDVTSQDYPSLQMSQNASSKRSSYMRRKDDKIRVGPRTSLRILSSLRRI